MKFPLKYKINLVVVIIILLFSPILFIYFPQQQQQQLTESYEKEVTGIARTISLGARIALEERNFGGVQTAMGYANNDKRMLYVALFRIDDSGNSTFMSLIPRTFNPEEIKLESDKKMVVKLEKFNAEGFNGQIVVGYSKQTINEKIEQARKTTIILSSIVSLLAIMLGFFVSRIITKPISALTDTTKKITEGDLSVRASASSRDETGLLSDSFNFMIGKLQENTLLLEEQKKDLDIKNKLVTESINYSNRIQRVLLYNENDLLACYPKSFMFFKPKDIVSGDFLWFKDTEKYSYVALVDCTGHGVPGAMMSIIGHFILNNIYYSKTYPLPGKILQELNNNLRISLKQDTADASDGMDLALCRIEKSTNEVIFSGANRNLYQFKQNQEIVEYKGDRKGIGGKPPKIIEFVNHTLKIEPGDWLITYTDGIQDQFSPVETKFGKMGVTNTIGANRDKTGTEICAALKEAMAKHQGNEKQTDDMLLIGIKI